jgi:RND family efflux transporter MFP subunit
MRLATVFLFVSASLLAGCQKPTPAVVSRRDIVGYENPTAELVTPQTAQAVVLATYRAPVQRVMATVGARVRRGEVLVELSFPSTQAAFEQARLNVKTAQTNLANAQSEYGRTIAALQQRVKALRDTRDSGGAYDPTELEAAERDLQTTISARNAAVEPYKEALRQAQQSLADAQAGAKLASLRAPISGTVLELNAVSGQEVGVDTRKPVATIVDLEALEVHAILNNTLQPKEGDEVLLSFKELPNQTFNGSVSRIVTLAADNTRRAVVDFRNDDGLVKPGMHAAAAIKVGEVKNVLAVPSQAVDVDNTGRPVVRVLRGGDWVDVVVEVGLSDGKFTEIKSGVSEGDTVQVTP